MWLSKTPWRESGLARPRSWLSVIVAGIVLGVAFKFAMKALVMPLLGADPVNQLYRPMQGNLPMLLEFLPYAILGAGFAEELVFRGWLFERLGKLLGAGVAQKILIVVVSAAIFGALHFAQGWPGIEQAAIVGLVFGTIFAATGRLWTLMVTHAVFDITAALMIYTGTEIQISHLVFK